MVTCLLISSVEGFHVLNLSWSYLPIHMFWSYIFVTNYVGTLGPVSDLGVDISSESVQVKWTKPHSLDGVPIFGFNVTLTENITKKVVLDDFHDNSTTAIEVGPSLVMCRAYQVKVWATNEVGRGNEASMTWFNPGGTR